MRHWHWRAIQDLLAELGLWLALIGFGYALTFRFDGTLQVYRFGAAAWPRAVLTALLVVAILQFALGVRARLSGRDRIQRRLEQARGRPSARLLGMFALPIVYLLLLPGAGFYLTTPLFLSGYMLLLGERRLRHLVGTSLLVYALTLLIFAKLLFVALPTGNWPGFYDFSNWLLVHIR